MKTLLSLLCCIALLLACCPALADESARSLGDFNPPLRDLAAQHGFKIGICLSPHQLGDA